MLTQEKLRENLSYCAETGKFTWLKSAPRGGRRVAGRVAGSLCPDGYIEIAFENVRYKAHRLAWLYIHGRWPDEVIDHINGVRDDNRESNLREASQAQNCANMRRSKANKTGFKGVYLNKKLGRYQANIKDGGKIRNLGLHYTAEAAHEAYIKAANDIHGEFARAG